MIDNSFSSSPHLVAIYARVSTARQEEDQTIKTQLSAVKEFANRSGYVIVKEYIDDGWSGDLLARPALDQLREDAKLKMWDAVLAYDPDRIARRYSYQALVMDELRDIGVGLLFVTTPSPTTGEEKILHGVKGLFAEYERVKIAERCRLGKLRKAKEGQIITSEAPYGYRYIPQRPGESCHYEINEAEARVVKMIFSWIADEGLTLRRVIKKLQELEIIPRKSKRGVWSTSTLQTMVRNRTYIGEAHYGASYAVVPERPFKKEKYRKLRKTSRRIRPQNEWISIPVPAIIDQNLFDRTAEQLKRNFLLSDRNRKNLYLLSGLIYCSCGTRRAGEGPQHGKHLYYRCTARVMSYPLPPECTERGVNARIADRLVWDQLRTLLASPGLLQQLTKTQISRRQGTCDSRLEEIDKRLRVLKQQEDRYAKAYGAGLITMEQLKEYVDGVRDQRSSLHLDRNRLQEDEPIVDCLPRHESEIRAFAQCASDILQHDLNFNEKRAIVTNVVHKVVATRETLRIMGMIPLRPLSNLPRGDGQNTNQQLTENVGQKTEHRHGVNTIGNQSLPFELVVLLPPPRYDRLITQRDPRGRIIHSTTPPSC
jgi:site-specific DNA recombinase